MRTVHTKTRQSGIYVLYICKRARGPLAQILYRHACARKRWIRVFCFQPKRGRESTNRKFFGIWAFFQPSFRTFLCVMWKAWYIYSLKTLIVVKFTLSLNLIRSRHFPGISPFVFHSLHANRISPFPSWYERVKIRIILYRVSQKSERRIFSTVRAKRVTFWHH